MNRLRWVARLITLLVVVVARPVWAAAVDSDADGLPDDWERRGVMLEGSAGPRWIDLPAMGADPLKPDVFLQIDWMAGAEHDQRPLPEALKMVVDAFAAAPYVSPTGSVGIALHIDAGHGSQLAEPGVTWGALSRARALPWKKNLGTLASGTYDWSAFEQIEDAPGGFAESGRAAIFHYAIFAHYHDLDDRRGFGASGNSRGIGATDLLITLGNFTDGVGSAQEQAGTLMHELGHNLGLRHGGCDDTNMRPGYQSVMNYSYQMEGLTRGGMHGVVDYSRGRSPALDDALFDAPLPFFAGAAAADAGKASTCVLPARMGAGSSMKPTIPPRTVGSDGDECEDGAGVDDWKSIRLKVGLIGHAVALSRPR
jgi:hypothetical protein